MKQEGSKNEAGRVEDSRVETGTADRMAAEAMARVQEFINRSAGQHLRAIKGRS